MAIEPQNPLVWAWSVAWMPQQPIAPTVWQTQQTNNNLLLPYQQIPWLDTNFNAQQPTQQPVQQPTQPIQITIPQQQPQGWQQPVQQTQPVQTQNIQQGSFQQPKKPVPQNQNTEPLWLAWLWAWPAFPWFASEYVKWKFDDLPTLDIAKGLSDWTIKDSDLKWMSFLNPDKFSQVQKAKTTIVSYDQANKLASWDIGKAEKDKTQQIIKDTQTLPQSVQTAIQTWSNLADKLTKLYDQQINTPEIKKITEDMGNLDREIVKLQNEKENAKNNIIKEFPTSLTWTALNALIMDRTEDINRELNTKLWLKQTYQSQLSDLTKKAEQRFWLISNILQKEDDRNYEEFKSNLDITRKKDLMKYERDLAGQYWEYLDKIPTPDWGVAYYDKRTNEIVWSFWWNQNITSWPTANFFNSFNPVNLNMQGNLWDRQKWFSGLDLQAKYWTPIPSPVAGKVIRANKQSDWNIAVTIQTADWHQLAFNHLSSFPVKVWQSINIWDIIGNVWNSWKVLKADWSKPTAQDLANWRGSHLDFTIKKPDWSFVRPDTIPQYLNQFGWSKLDNVAIAKFNNSTFKPQNIKNSNELAQYEQFLNEKDSVMSNPDSTSDEILRFSRWGKPLDATASQQIKKYAQSLADLESLQSDIANIDTWPFVWLFTSNNPYDTDAQVIKAKLEWLLPNLAKWLYWEVWVLTDTDIERYRRTVPNLQNTNDKNNAVLAMLLKSLQRWISSNLRLEASNNKDVSGYTWILNWITNRVNSLERQIWVSDNWWDEYDMRLNNNGWFNFNSYTMGAWD